MVRQLRIEYAGAFYHITSRGNAQIDIYSDDLDRREFLSLFSATCKDFFWRCHAYCLMSNHYHLLIETAEPTLSKGMRRLNGVYTQRYNRRHNRVGHLLQGRFNAVLVESDTYLLELARYIVLNPVRAQMVHSAGDWPWSSYRATAGYSDHEQWLTTDCILSSLGRSRNSACENYREFIAEGKNQPSPWNHLKNQIYLGSDAFVANALGKIKTCESLQEIPKTQKLAAPKPLDYYREQFEDRDAAISAAYLAGHYSMAAVGEHFGVSRATVARAVTKHRESVQWST